MKIKYILLFIVATSFSCMAQKLEKIKGNKEVVDVYIELEPFTALEVSSGLEVSIKQSDEDGYHLETDSNLVDVIAFEVADGKLHIYAKNNILSSKRLNIDLDVSHLDMITLNDGAELNGINKIEATSLSIIALDNSSYKLDVSAEALKVIMNDNSKGDLALKGGTLSTILNGNSTLKGDMTINECNLEVNERSDFDMDGDVLDFKVTTTGSANIKASTLRAENVNIIASEDSELYVNATKKLVMYAQGKSTIYVFGNPEIQVDGFKDTSRLFKK